MRIDKKRKKSCNFCTDNVILIDFKDAQKLKRYSTDRGKILPRRITGTCAYHQKMLAKTIKQARQASVIPFVMEGI
jgi:small subunit ribosomal protein S18